MKQAAPALTERIPAMNPTAAEEIAEQTLMELDAVVDLFEDPFSADAFRAAVQAIRSLYTDAGPVRADSLLAGWLDAQAEQS